MADTLEDKMARRAKRGTSVKVQGKYYAAPAKRTKKQDDIAKSVGLSLINPSYTDSNTVLFARVQSVVDKAKNLNETRLTLLLRWLNSVLAEAKIEEAEPLYKAKSLSEFKAYRKSIGEPWFGFYSAAHEKNKEAASKENRQNAQAVKSKVQQLIIAIGSLNKNLQVAKRNALRQAYAQSKGYTSDDAYAEYVATTGSEFEWYAKTYGTEDPIRIEALKTLERRDNQGKTGFELALEGKEMSSENVDALIVEMDETALTEQVALALQEEQKQAELARQASEKRNQILLYTAGGVGVAAVIYLLFLRK